MYLCTKIKAFLRETDEIGIADICRWDNAAMGWLYDNFYRALVAYACQYVAQPVAEDAVQELFSVLWERRPAFRSLPQLTSYLYTSMHNLAVNHLRHLSVHASYKQSIADHLEEFLLVDDVSEVYNKEEVYRRLMAAVDRLPPRQREVFVLCMEGKKNREIAAQLDISAETVKVQKRRAINALREQLSCCLTLIIINYPLIFSEISSKNELMVN